MLRKAKPKKEKQSTKGKPDLVDKLDKFFSRYIRLRDAMSNGYFKCISCGKYKKLQQADNGHYINRKHMKLRFSEINCNAQCRDCNRFDEGNIIGYRQGLIQKYGEAQVLLLESMKNETKKWEEWELKSLIEHYQKEVKRLEKEKGIKL